MHVIDVQDIRDALAGLDLVPLIEAGFVAYSEGRAVVPPVGELLFDDPPGEVHIKYGYIRGDDVYVIKIASGFHQNPRLGIPSGDGLMMLFDRRTGEPLCALVDRGLLTDVRTAVAGAIAARHLAPDPVTRIGIVGTGTQARLQLRHLADITPCRHVVVLGRTPEHVERFRAEMTGLGYDVAIADSAADLCARCNLIVTTTPATAPLLHGTTIRTGTHITAVGSDAAHKRELDGALLARADRVVADSIAQCIERGEVAHGLREGHIRREDVVELGDVIAGRAPGRAAPEQITVADLTGVAVQDIQIAGAVYERIAGKRPS